jgi:ferric-dicitrate binding protein FerR (iron transport regulator)
MHQETDIVGSIIRSAGRRAEPPEEAYRQVFAAASAAFHQKTRRRRDRLWLLYAGAAAAAVLAVALMLRWTPPAAQQEVLATVVRSNGAVEVATGDLWRAAAEARIRLTAGVRLRTPSDGRAALALSSGHSVRLAAGTEVMFDAPGRIYVERGMIYVDSGTQPAAAGIAVVTPAGTARDLGTQFELQVAGSRLRLRVREGSVSIDRAGRSLTGRAGEQLAFDDFGRVSRSTIPRNDDAWRWAEDIAPVPDIEGKSAAELIAWVARETGRELRYESAAVEQRAAIVILHGDIRHLAPADALAAMLATTDLECVLEGATMNVRLRDPLPPRP